MRILVLACLLMVAGCRTVGPQSVAAPSDVSGWRSEPGDILISGSGSFIGRKLANENLTTITLQGGLSYVIAPGHELGGEISATNFDSDQRATFLAGRYSYLLERTAYGRPYAGVHAGFYDLKTSTESGTDPAFGIHFGLRHWLTPGIGFYVEPRFSTSHAISDSGVFFGIILNLSPRDGTRPR